MERRTVARDEDLGATVIVTVRRVSVRAQRVDQLYRWGSLLAALGVVVTVLALLILTLGRAWPSITANGLGFIQGTVWNSTTNVYGALPFIVDTFITTALSVLLALPLCLVSVIVLTYYLPRPLATLIDIGIDVASGIPTIVFGAWAALVLVPWMSATIEPAASVVLHWLPFLDPATTPAGLTGYGLATATLVLAAMIAPTILALLRTCFLAVPQEVRESALSLGATRWEVATGVVLREVRQGVLGAVLLASGRALGETMAVVYVLGLSPRLPLSLFDEGYTLATMLFTQLFGGNAIPGSMSAAALYELALLLLLLSLATSLVGRYLTRRIAGSLTMGTAR